MKASFLIIFVAMTLSGCTSKDPIANFVGKEQGDRYFGNGPFKRLNLPRTAPIDELVTQAFENAFPVPVYPENINVITQRQVNISGEEYTAVLVNTEHGERVVVLRYSDPMHGWWNHVYGP
jgi:hypothetical protein